MGVAGQIWSVSFDGNSVSWSPPVNPGGSKVGTIQIPAGYYNVSVSLSSWAPGESITVDEGLAQPCTNVTSGSVLISGAFVEGNGNPIDIFYNNASC